MIEIIKNKFNIKEENINRTVVRVKALIINSKNEILLAHSYGEYQFPGGHVEANEELPFALHRELLEETGLYFDTDNLKPFAVCKQYWQDYPSLNTNSKFEIYYYEIRDDRVPDLAKTNLTEEEKDGNFKLRYIPLSIVEDVVKSNMLVNGDPQGIGTEMLEIFSRVLK